MHEPLIDGGTIRKLWIGEAELYREHLLRLDAESRRNRFGGAVSDEFIRKYSEPSTLTDALSTVGARRKKRHANKLAHGKNDWSQGIVVRIEIREPRGGTPARRRLGDAGACRSIGSRRTCNE